MFYSLCRISNFKIEKKNWYNIFLKIVDIVYIYYLIKF